MRPPRKRCDGGEHVSTRQLEKRKKMTWNAPKIVEVAVGMEINMYACASRKTWLVFRCHPPERTIWTVAADRETTAQKHIQPRMNDLHTYAFRISADGLPPDRYFQIASSRPTKLMKGMLS